MTKSLQGVKFDTDKPRVGFLLTSFPLALEAVAKQNDFGAKKYTDKGWCTVENGVNRYSDALGRHFLAEGTNHLEVDVETQQLHATAVAWNSLARLQLILETQHTNSQPLQSRPPTSDNLNRVIAKSIYPDIATFIALDTLAALGYIIFPSCSPYAAPNPVLYITTPKCSKYIKNSYPSKDGNTLEWIVWESGDVIQPLLKELIDYKRDK